MAFGNRSSEAVVELKKQDRLTGTFNDKLWAVCVRPADEMLEALRKGATCISVRVRHWLVKRKFRRQIRCSWIVSMWSADGSFCIGPGREDSFLYTETLHTGAGHPQ